VNRKSPEEGHIALGFQISGDGKCIVQKKATQEKTYPVWGINQDEHNLARKKWHVVQLILHAELGIWDTSHKIDKYRL
jgi:hypothetical protein